MGWGVYPISPVVWEGCDMKIDINFWKWKIKWVINSSNFNFHILKKPTAGVEGITSRCSDLKHCLFLDYDFIERWIVEDELRLIQKEFNLTPFYLFTTYEEDSPVSKKKFGNYMAICLTKKPLWDIYNILKTTHCDWKYKEMFKFSRYKSFVLRITKKGERPAPKYIGLIGEMENLNNDVSSAHLKILGGLYDLEEVDYSNLDGLGEAYITSYNTLSHLKI